MIDSSFSLLCRVIAPAAMELLPPSTLFLPPPVDSIDSITSFVFIAAVVFCFVLISAHRPDGTILFASLTLGGGGRGWKGVGKAALMTSPLPHGSVTSPMADLHGQTGA